MSRWLARALAVVVAVLAIASVSVSCGRTLVVSTMQDAPVGGAYVVYHYEGRTYAVIETLTYQASRIAILKTDDAGRVTIPGAIHVHWPLVQSHPRIAVNLIYAPPVHNGLARVNTRVAVSRPQEFEVSPDLRHVRLEDVSGDPSLWRGTLENLSSLLGQLTSQGMRHEEMPQLTSELIEHFKGEYAAILNRYGSVMRAPPQMPAGTSPQEKSAWQAMVDKDLAERPRWGDELKRRFGTEIDIYAR